MENNNLNNLAPFYVGQKVVCIKTHTIGIYKQGQVFTITDVYIQKCGCKWVVNIGVFSNIPTMECSSCGFNYSQDNGFAASSFKPLQESVFPSLTMSKVLEKESQLISMN